MISNIWLFSEDFSICSEDFDGGVDPDYCALKDIDFKKLTADVRCDCANYTIFRTTASPTNRPPIPKDPWTTRSPTTTAGKFDVTDTEVAEK